MFCIKAFSQEDFTTYTEVHDVNGHLYSTTDSINVTKAIQPPPTLVCYGIKRNEHIHYVKDFGADYFDGDFSFELEILVYDDGQCAQDLGLGMFCVLSNVDNDVGDLIVGDDDYIGFYVFTGQSGVYDQQIVLEEFDSGTSYKDTYGVSSGIVDTQFWYRMYRDENASTYGTLYLYIYSDEERTTGVDTLSLELHTSKKDYRYLIPVSTRYSNVSLRNMVMNFSNLNLDAETSGGSSSQASSRRTRRRGILRTIFRE